MILQDRDRSRFASWAAPVMGREMFMDMRAAVMASPRSGLAELSATMWRVWSAGGITDDEATELSACIEARKVMTSERQAGMQAQRRHVGSRPRSSASMERRRRWSASGWLPPEIACRFTVAEQAALSVVAVEVMEKGRCELPIAAIAGKAGVCETIVKRAMRQAKALGLVNIVERRMSYARNLANVVTITSSSWSTWLRFRARKLRQAPGGTFVPPIEHHMYSSYGESFATEPAKGKSEVQASRSRPEPGKALRW